MIVGHTAYIWHSGVISPIYLQPNRLWVGGSQVSFLGVCFFVSCHTFCHCLVGFFFNVSIPCIQACQHLHMLSWYTLCPESGSEMIQAAHRNWCVFTEALVKCYRFQLWQLLPLTLSLLSLSACHFTKPWKCDLSMPWKNLLLLVCCSVLIRTSLTVS